MNKPTAIALVFAAALLPVNRSCHAEEYASGVLIEANELIDELAEPTPKTTIFDIRSAEAYAEGHLPGAIRVDLADWRKNYQPDGQRDHPNLPAEVWKGRLVVYSDTFDRSVARAWWLLRYWGVEKPLVLNGGWQAWREANGPVDTKSHDLDRLADASSANRSKLRVTGPKLRLRLSAGEQPTLIDARSEREYEAGCVPGAKRLEWSDMIDTESGKLLPADELRKKFASIGVDPKKPTISYCRSGGRASVLVLAQAALGSEEAVNYYGSWREWEASGAARPDEEDEEDEEAGE